MNKDVSMPRHIGIIMDGNGRWAQKRNKPRPVGHRNGVRAVRRTIDYCDHLGIKYLTLYVFSAENWKRPQNEVSLLMSLFVEMMKKELKTLAQKQAKIVFLGNKDRLPESVQKTLFEAVEKTKNNTGLVLQLALSYGGRDEIVEATKQICRDALSPEDISEELFAHYLFQPNTPDPELIIRTGGNFRISNFLLWQAAYAELYFTETLWPDFTEKELDAALNEFHLRERRFGRVRE
ncbi:isoprenyl transferase [Chitinivibrio alkaliphilus]|uniref:Isoprenyl transferase n=1 Tax=Chitinivibrio alkaliphilus ACht1 TaxID=1313304 RepID=U7D918_9BACT|nr:isoprenyl transferase [Chitinivibrio alkaliphilus]ERP38884.1 undecaprenyl pyrophosphate synthase [Chitinivibrio alkaliphilus ACht1]